MMERLKILLLVCLSGLVVACTRHEVAKPSVCFFGSSVCRGEGADSLRGYAYQVGEQLPEGWTYTNLSVNGNNTYDLLARFDDILTTDAKYVVIGLSLGNEHLHEAGEAAVLSYTENMQTLIRMLRNLGKVPIVTNNYTRADFNEVDYRDIQRVNLGMQQWDVPTINLCGVIDDGAGHWAEGYWNGTDIYHPNMAGHTEMMTAFPPSLFEALEQKKPMPERPSQPSAPAPDMREKVVKVSFEPEGLLHSYTLSYMLGDTTYTVVHSHARQLTWHYKNAQCVSQTADSVAPKSFAVEGRQLHDLFFYRSALNPLEVKALSEGGMLRSSLDIYAPIFFGNKVKDDNLAQSLTQIKSVVY